VTLSLSDPSAAVDWFELACLSRTASLLRRSDMARLIEEVEPDLDEEGIENALGDIAAEISRRSIRAGSLYPLTVDLYGIHRRAVPAEVERLYLFLALCSAVPQFRTNQTGFQPGRVFERIAAVALAQFTAGTAVVFADLPDPGVRGRIRELGRMLNVADHAGRARRQRKDHGLDVASWRAFSDSRAGHPVFLCQCALARRPTTLIRKAREIQPGEWGGLLDLREGTFSAALAIPHALEPGYEHWDELRGNTDLIVERIRLLSLLEGSSSWIDSLPPGGVIDSAVQGWVAKQIPDRRA
jgi:hypothetical protein